VAGYQTGVRFADAMQLGVTVAGPVVFVAKSATTKKKYVVFAAKEPASKPFSPFVARLTLQPDGF
jgi:hypothetical protein